jgi:hypothetical protein
MKKAILAIMVLGLCFGLATSAMAAEETTTVTVTVSPVELLEVPGTVSITLAELDDENPGEYTTGRAESPGGLEYTHNSSTSKKITATAEVFGEMLENDITLKVQIEGETEQEVVIDGVGAETDVLLWDNIEADSYTKDLTWTADATVKDTPAGSYEFTVTFTAADAQ